MKPQLLIIGVCLVMFVLNLGGAVVFDMDEAIFTACAQEMHQRGDWVVPWYNGELFGHKPILMYWNMLAAFSLLGVTEFAARIGSALFGTGTVLMTYAIGCRLFDRRLAFWSSIALSTMLMFCIASRAATPDSVFIFFMTAAMLTYVHGTFKARDSESSGDSSSGAKSPGVRSAPELRVEGHYYPRSWSVIVLMYGLMGLAMLAKGPLGLVVPTAVIGMFLLLKRPWPTWFDGRRGWLWAIVRLPFHFVETCWHMRPITAICISMLVAAPWYIIVGLRTDWLWPYEFFYVHHFVRASSSMEGHGGSKLFYYPLAMLFGTFPWSVFFIPALIDLVRRIRRADVWSDSLVFAACWVCVVIGIFSMAGTKLPSYITPMYPGVAMLYAGYLYFWTRNESLAGRYWPYAAMGVLALVGIGLGIGLPIAARHLLPGAELLGLAGLIPLVGAVVCCLILFHGARGSDRSDRGLSSTYRRTLGVFTVTSVLFFIAMFGPAMSFLSSYQRCGQLVETVHANSDSPEIAAFGCHEASWVFYARQPIPRINESDVDELQAFLTESPGNRFVITTGERYRELTESSDELDVKLQVLDEIAYFMQPKRLLLISSESAEHVARSTDVTATYR